MKILKAIGFSGRRHRANKQSVDIVREDCEALETHPRKTNSEAHIFHLAIPTDNIEKSKDFYVNAFGAKVGREYSHYVIFHFFGHQLVCHKDEKNIPQKVSMYPRHFGIILNNSEEFDAIYKSCKKHNVTFFEEHFERFINKPGWHHSFFVVDPSNNLVELKYYVNPQDIFS